MESGEIVKRKLKWIGTNARDKRANISLLIRFQRREIATAQCR